MTKYAVTIHTEEMKGRMEENRVIECLSYEHAQEVLEREYEAIARKRDLFVDEDIDDDVRVVEYFPRMRTTLTIKEA